MATNIYPTQTRTVDPFASYSSQVQNRLTRILSLGNNAILINSNSLDVTVDTTSTVIVNTGKVLKDDALIEVTADFTIDVTDLAFYPNGTSGAMNETGYYYICLDYTHSLSKPAPEAAIRVLKPSQRPTTFLNSRYVFLKAISVINDGGVNVLSTAYDTDPSGGSYANNTRTYLKTYVGIVNTLPTFDAEDDEARILLNKSDNGIYIGDSTGWINIAGDLGTMAYQDYDSVTITGGDAAFSTLAVSGDPAAGDDVGNRDYNDLRYSVYMKNNWDATRAPNSNDDSSEGYTEGSTWVDTTAGPDIYRCTDSSVGSALWVDSSIDIGGLGTMASQDSNAVSITGGSITGITDLAVADGGTGASNASGARTNLDVQQLNSGLTDISGLAKTDGNIIVGDGANWVAESGATARASLGLTIGTDVQAYDANLQDIAGLVGALGDMIINDGANWIVATPSETRTSLELDYLNSPSDSDFLVGDGATWVKESGATARNSLGLGSMATQNASNVSITGGTIEEADVDKAKVDYSPTYYDPELVSGVSDELYQVSSHLKGIVQMLKIFNTFVAGDIQLFEDSNSTTGCYPTQGIYYEMGGFVPNRSGTINIGIRAWQSHYYAPWDGIKRYVYAKVYVDGVLYAEKTSSERIGVSPKYCFKFEDVSFSVGESVSWGVIWEARTSGTTVMRYTSRVGVIIEQVGFDITRVVLEDEGLE